MPVLWDKQTKMIVNNESLDLMQQLNHAFDAITNNELDLYPESHRVSIEAMLATLTATINNGVYRCGFTRDQAAYEAACTTLFGAQIRQKHS